MATRIEFDCASLVWFYIFRSFVLFLYNIEANGPFFLCSVINAMSIIINLLWSSFCKVYRFNVSCCVQLKQAKLD